MTADQFIQHFRTHSITAFKVIDSGQPVIFDLSLVQDAVVANAYIAQIVKDFPSAIFEV